MAASIIKEIEKAKGKAYYDPTLDEPDIFTPSNIRNYYWHNWWKVYGCGLIGSLEGIIFTNWSQVDGIPKDARLLGYAIDFGFTNDPSTLIAAYKWNGRIIWDEMIYQTGLTNGDIARMMKSMGVRPTDFIVADSAEPKSITEINRYGFKIKPAEKGKDSINFGIDVLQEEEFYVTKRSTNMIKELRKYMWDRDKTGRALNKPIDAFNHTIDPMRYLSTAKMSKQKQKRGLKRRN